MLARWFDRSGIGQILAPDEKAAKLPCTEEARSELWQFLAPDPKFQPPKAPPRAAFIHPFSGTDDAPGTPLPENLKTPEKHSIISTPSATPDDSASKQRLDSLVLSAAKDTAVCMTSPAGQRESRDKLFRLCSSQRAINEKLLKKLRNMLVKDPSLIHSRATHLGQLAPDGYTPLMATAHADHVVAAKVIIELGSDAIAWDRDLQGRTALHIAAERGNLDMINVLMPLYQSQPSQTSATTMPPPPPPPPPVDLLGRTPLGRAVTSPNPKARKRQKELESVLFSPGDLSVFGEPKPESTRTGQDETLQLVYGLADMPGRRVIMEDAIISSYFTTSDDKSYRVFGVCDGHGDQGLVSQFLADNMTKTLQKFLADDEKSNPDWNDVFVKTCSDLDQQLKNAEINGGSTAVIVVISTDSIIVANVGDSRAILVQSSPPPSTSEASKIEELEAKVELMTVSEPEDDEGGSEAVADSGYPHVIDEDSPQHATPDKALETNNSTNAEEEEEEKQTKTESAGPHVIALSEDHKPELEEEQKRITNAGMSVIPTSYEEENGKTVTLYHVVKSDTERLAVSRSFGDFEYKDNVSLGLDEQAVVAVPDVQVYARDTDKDCYIVLACDGIWDVMSNRQVAEFIFHQVSIRNASSTTTTTTILPEVADALLVECFNCGSRDNMSTIVISLNKEFEKITRPSSMGVLHGKTLDFGSPTK